MPFVLDASVTLAWVFDDENHPAAAVALQRIRNDGAQVPSLWWYEVRNSLIVNERRQRLTEADTFLFLRSLSSFEIVTDPLPDQHRVLALARRHGLSVYDAVYLELSERMRLPLATLDAKLGRAALKEGVELLATTS
jgi:predicted nucleic acid-binding protein